MIVVQDQDDLPGEAIHQLVGEGIQGGEAPGFMEPLGRGATQPGVQRILTNLPPGYKDGTRGPPA
jgi:hypothetical protein